MIRVLRTIFWNYLITQVITICNIACLEIPSTDQFLSTPDIACFHPNETHFPHGTIEREEDNILSQEVQTASVIFLHGLGGTGKKVKDAMLFLKPGDTSRFRHTKIITPTAPLIPYTPENGNLSHAWFDRTSSRSPEEPNTLKKTMKDLNELIQREMALGIPLDRIVIGGFSQGGAMALHVAYRNFCENSSSLAGVFALSAYLHRNSTLYEALKGKELKKAPPLYYSHGTKDKVVLYQWGNETFERLKSFGIQGEFKKQSKVEHKINTKGFHQLYEWLERILP